MIELRAGLSREDVAAVLGAALRISCGAGTRLEHWTAQPLSDHGRHRVVRYDVLAQAPGGLGIQTHQWVCKFYDRAADARRVAAVLQQLDARARRARAAFVVPQVRGYSARHRVLLMTYEPGESVRALMVKDPGAALTAIARALAALHACPVACDVIASPVTVIADLQPRIGELGARFPAHAAWLRDALDRLQRESPGIPAAPVFVHGDVGFANLLWREGAIVVLDFDRCARGDPAVDLGNLLTQLRRRTLRTPGKLPAFQWLRNELLEAYQRKAPPSPPSDPGLERRVTWYERATLLRKIQGLACDTTRHPEAEALRQRHDEAVCLLGAAMSEQP